jgi:hypothetical protein
MHLHDDLCEVSRGFHYLLSLQDNNIEPRSVAATPATFLKKEMHISAIRKHALFQRRESGNVGTYEKRTKDVPHTARIVILEAMPETKASAQTFRLPCVDRLKIDGMNETE